MCLPPIWNEEEEELYLEPWAREALKSYVPVPHCFGVGDRVYGILYGSKFGSPYGTVVHVSKDGTGVGVKHDDGVNVGALWSYFIPLPPEHDPKRGGPQR